MTNLQTHARGQGAIPIGGVASASVGPSVVVNGDALASCERWPAPTCIIADGPYGLGKFPGEPKTPEGLGEWYAPHIAQWHRKAAPDCTLWFWNTELGWAIVHPFLEELGWQYEELCVWDKGIGHIAGNVNSKTIRGMPVATEVAVRYTRKNKLRGPDGHLLSIKEWLRSEWRRSGLPMHRANDACGVKNAATRKYLTACHLWYFPPAEAVQGMAEYCRQFGLNSDEWPYFSLDGHSQFDRLRWNRLRAKWHHVHGLTNVWREPAVHGEERVKGETGYIHANQKPLALMRMQITASTEASDVVWEPFGGLCSASVAAMELGRRSYAAEINPDYYEAAITRLRTTLRQSAARGVAA